MAPPDSSSMFRVVKHHGQRHGFKLERIFWKILRLAAAEKGNRIGVYIGSVLDGRDRSENKSSVLRTHAAEWLGHKLLSTTSTGINATTVTRIVQALPLPGFLMDRDHRITSQNELFLTMLRATVQDARVVSGDAVRIHFKTDIKVLQEKLASANTQFIEDELSIQFGVRRMDKRARVIRISPMRGPALGLLVMIMP